jgi:hypothetical protein
MDRLPEANSFLSLKLYLPLSYNYRGKLCFYKQQIEKAAAFVDSTQLPR